MHLPEFYYSVRRPLLICIAGLMAMFVYQSCAFGQNPPLTGEQVQNPQTNSAPVAPDLLTEIKAYLARIQMSWNDINEPNIDEFLKPYEGSFELQPLEQTSEASPKSLIERFHELRESSPTDIGQLLFDAPKISELSGSTRIVSATWQLVRNQRVIRGDFVIGIQRDDEQWTITADPVSLGNAIIVEKPRVNFGWTSIIPPLLAIFLAIVTRRVLVSLFFGCAVGCGMLAGSGGVMNLTDIWYWLIESLNVLCESFLWSIMIEDDKQRILWFVVLMGAMVGVVHRSGGMHGIVDVLTPYTKSRVGGQFVSWLLGLIIFFDDYANTLLLGNTMRPVTDRLKISREKLAYIVDSTAAPVAGLAIISTWVAMLISQVDLGFQGVENDLKATLDYNAFNIVVKSIPYRFYVIFAIIFVVMIALLGRDFGPMLKAEQRAADGEPPEETVELDDESDMPSRKWYNAVLPIAALVVFTILFLLTTGRQAAIDDKVELTFFNIFSRGNSYIALVYGSLLGLFVALILVSAQKLMTPGKLFDAAWSGIKTVIPAMAILWLAWTLSALTSNDNLGTQDYLASLLTVKTQPDWCSTQLFIIYQNFTSVVWLPTAIAMLSAFVAFATGSSWGTMGIMGPLVIKVTYELTTLQLGECPPDHPLMLAAIGSVIAGSIFGDHCSPISDTTVLSSQASSCNHIAHVRTQMPYAIFVGIISIIFGTLPVGLMARYESNLSMPIALAGTILFGIVTMLCFLLVFGRRIKTSPGQQQLQPTHQPTGKGSA